MAPCVCGKRETYRHVVDTESGEQFCSKRCAEEHGAEIDKELFDEHTAKKVRERKARVAAVNAAAKAGDPKAIAKVNQRKAQRSAYDGPEAKKMAAGGNVVAQARVERAAASQSRIRGRLARKASKSGCSKAIKRLAHYDDYHSRRDGHKARVAAATGNHPEIAERLEHKDLWSKERYGRLARVKALNGDPIAIAILAKRDAKGRARHEAKARKRDLEFFEALNLSDGLAPAPALEGAALEAATDDGAELVHFVMRQHPHAVVGVQLSLYSRVFAESVTLGHRQHLGAFVPTAAFHDDAVVLVVYRTVQPHHAAAVERRLHERLIDAIPAGQRLFHAIGAGGPAYPFPGVPYAVTLTVFVLGWPAGSTLMPEGWRAEAVALAMARRTAELGSDWRVDLQRARSTLTALAAAKGINRIVGDVSEVAHLQDVDHHLRVAIGAMSITCLRAVIATYAGRRVSPTLSALLSEALARKQSARPTDIRAYFGAAAKAPAPVEPLGGANLLANLLEDAATQALEDDAAAAAEEDEGEDEEESEEEGEEEGEGEEEEGAEDKGEEEEGESEEEDGESEDEDEDEDEEGEDEDEDAEWDEEDSEME